MRNRRVLLTLVVCFVAGSAVEAADLGTAGGDIHVAPESLAFAVPIDGTDTSVLEIRNDSPVALGWLILVDEPAGGVLSAAERRLAACEDSTPVPWMSVKSGGGILEPGLTAGNFVRVDASGLAVGSHKAVLCVFAGSPEDLQAEVPVTLSVVEDALQFVPEILFFGNVPVGTQSPPQVTTFTNIGTGDATGISFSTPGSDFAADAADCGNVLAPAESCSISVTFTPPARVLSTATLTATTGEGPIAELALGGNGVNAVLPSAFEVDPPALVPDANGVFEPGESVTVAPVWWNASSEARNLAGAASSFTGPTPAAYILINDDAEYGEIAAGTTKTWTLHIGDSFIEVPRSSLLYTAIETLLGSGVTGGCGGGEEYRPNRANSRSQMPVFMLRALMGAEYVPPPCDEGNERFTDVPCPSLFADWIEDLAAREITGGCSDTAYCPGDPVTRGQMAVFGTRTFGLGLYGP